MQYRRALLAAVWLIGMAQGQTLVDLRTQSKSVDFSAANTTKPFKAGTALPATCGVGEAFFQTNAAAGLNLYGCTAVNSWTLLSAGILAGDVTGTPGASTVVQIQGRAVSATAPSSGQSLAWSTSTGWTPQTVAGVQGPAGPTGRPRAGRKQWRHCPHSEFRHQPSGGVLAELHWRRMYRRSNQQPHRLHWSGHRRTQHSSQWHDPRNSGDT